LKEKQSLAGKERHHAPHHKKSRRKGNARGSTKGQKPPQGAPFAYPVDDAGGSEGRDGKNGHFGS